MREIEFRGKHITDEKWIQGHGYAKHYFSHYVFDDELIEGCFILKGLSMVDPKTVGQYTGLKDKNEVKIFEGDIVLRTNIESSGIVNRIKHFIYFEDGCFTMRRIDSPFYISDYSMCKDYKTMIDLDPSCEYWSYEIIGNVYDTPALLGEAAS